ncbi:hypothetical protein AA0Y32_05160 [Georgenia phoenicis]|uniref:hypothetical protein n=1 Tax=unclassified Georgenia TaxID=2626815 RepID=UPI0039B06822
MSERIPVYTSAAPPVPTAEELRARIPGWGVDLDPADRPSYPKEREEPTGAHWDLPEQQEETYPRERSIEHTRLTPVFGTVAPLHGLSGAIRRYSYERFSEARAAHWLLLIAADRVDAVESHVRSLASRRPDNPVTETGVRTELTHDGVGARRDSSRADVKHQWIDPLLVAGPWVLAGAAAVAGARTLVRGRRG